MALVRPTVPVVVMNQNGWRNLLGDLLIVNSFSGLLLFLRVQRSFNMKRKLWQGGCQGQELPKWSNLWSAPCCSMWNSLQGEHTGRAVGHVESGVHVEQQVVNSPGLHMVGHLVPVCCAECWCPNENTIQKIRCSFALFMLVKCSPSLPPEVKNCLGTPGWCGSVVSSMIP